MKQSKKEVSAGPTEWETIKLHKSIVQKVRERKKDSGVTIGMFFEIAADRALEPERTEYSEDFLLWVAATGAKNLTSSQHVFVEWCFKHKETLSQIGGIEELFNSVRQYLKSNGK